MTRDEIIAVVKSEIPAHDLETAVVYLSQEERQPGAALEVSKNPAQFEKKGASVFVDLQPGANWAHPCRYLIVDGGSKRVENTAASFPPIMDDYKVLMQPEHIESWKLMTAERW